MADADRWRLAHAIVEAERDQARDERDKWEGKYLDTDEALHQARASLHEACKVAQSYKVDAYQATERAEAAERQRDEVQERADQLRDERDDAVQSCITLGRARDKWKARAEKAERELVPTAPPDNMDVDPVVYVVRESDLPDVERDEDGNWLCENTLVVNGKDTAEDLRGRALPQLKHVAMHEAVARAIEQAVDPVEAKARELFDEAGRGNSMIEFDEIRPDHRGEYLRIAAHVLGQEASGV